MGCHETIAVDRFPAQSKYVGARVKVYFHYGAARSTAGTIVRDDTEQPLRTIIRLDDGRFVLGTECQYGFGLPERLN